MDEQQENLNRNKFVNVVAAEKFDLISKNRSFNKEKGFHHPDDFFHKTKANKGWKALCQPPRSAATMVVREFYANLAANVLKKVHVRGVLVDFSAKSINKYYNLELVNSKAYDRLYEAPNYLEVLRMLINGQGGWKLNNEGHVVHFKANIWPTSPKCGITSSHHVSSRRPMCETQENSNFLKKKSKTVILVKIWNFSRSQMTKQTSLLESSRKI